MVRHTLKFCFKGRLICFTLIKSEFMTTKYATQKITEHVPKLSYCKSQIYIYDASKGNPKIVMTRKIKRFIQYPKHSHKISISKTIYRIQFKSTHIQDSKRCFSRIYPKLISFLHCYAWQILFPRKKIRLIQIIKFCFISELDFKRRLIT